MIPVYSIQKRVTNSRVSTPISETVCDTELDKLRQICSLNGRMRICFKNVGYCLSYPNKSEKSHFLFA